MQDIDQKPNQAPLQRQEDLESLVVPWVGRPSQPEKILEEFPLTNTEYLRYRVTGILPERYEDALKQGAKEFIRIGEEMAKRPTVEKKPVEKYSIEPEELESERASLRESLSRLLEKKEFSANTVSEVVQSIRAILECTRSNASGQACDVLVLSDEKARERISAQIDEGVKNTSEDPFKRACYLLLHAELYGSTYTSSYERRRFLQGPLLVELETGRSDTLLEGSSIAEFKDYLVTFVLNQRDEIPNEEASFVVGKLFPAILDTKEGFFLSSQNTPEAMADFTELVARLSDMVSAKERESLRTVFSDTSAHVIDRMLSYMQEGGFVCHMYALPTLKSLSQLHVSQGIPVKDPEQLKELLDEVTLKKLKGYPANYPRVRDIKFEIKTLSEKLDLQMEQASIAKPGVWDHVKRFMEKIGLRKSDSYW